MNLIDLAQSPLSLLPPVLALVLAIISRKVVLSLGAGIVLGGLMLLDFQPLAAANYIAQTAADVVYSDGELNRWNLSIIGFLILLGMLTALVTLSGGTRAFANWAQANVKSRRGSQLLAAFLGVLIFIDDYFNSLAVGAVSRPVTDRFKVSRSKLAYILDSTAAPMCVMMPASSWGAYIMTVVVGILAAHGLEQYSPLATYVQLIPMNFYALFAIFMVFAVIWFGLDIGAMQKREQAALAGEDQASADALDDMGVKASDHGRVADLLVPIVMLVLATLLMMLSTGAQVMAEAGDGFTLLGAFENTDVAKALVYGGLASVLTALLMLVRQRQAFASIGHALWVGAKSMFAAILVLLFAWTIGLVIGDLQTGSYLASLAEGNVAPQWLPVILFVLAGTMAFATGTSWGTFGIMLPIAGDLAGATDITLMLPMLASVLAGSVFGDHCSPISDTTILSSTGARCHHIDHVATQLPYALMVAVIAMVGFICLGWTGSTLLSLAASGVVFAGIIGILKQRLATQA